MARFLLRRGLGQLQQFEGVHINQEMNAWWTQAMAGAQVGPGRAICIF
jgi:hypothetical protein